MRLCLRSLALAGLLLSPLAAQQETLRYSVNWPSGLSLGEAVMEARPGEGGRREFEFRLDASIPGVNITDFYRSVTTADYCTQEFHKSLAHGKRQGEETTTVTPERGVARRVTARGGGASEIPVDACVRDGLAFLYFLRREVGQGRLPPPQTILFGAAYKIRVQFGGAQAIVVNGERADTDRFAVTVKGPASETGFEIYLARDAARTPLVVKVPLALGAFSMELMR